MTAEETNNKEDKTKSEGSGPMESVMLDMMEKCCSGEGSFSCSAMMKGMVKKMRSQTCCPPKTKDTNPEEGEK